MPDIQTSYVDGKTLIGADALLERYKVFLLTNIGEFSPDGFIGVGLPSLIGIPNTKTNRNAIAEYILSQTKLRFPEIEIQQIDVMQPELHTMKIAISLTLTPYGEQTTIQQDITSG